jgi:hypothetical protein
MSGHKYFGRTIEISMLGTNTLKVTMRMGLPAEVVWKTPSSYFSTFRAVVTVENCNKDDSEIDTILPLDGKPSGSTNIDGKPIHFTMRHQKAHKGQQSNSSTTGTYRLKHGKYIQVRCRLYLSVHRACLDRSECPKVKA